MVRRLIGIGAAMSFLGASMGCESLNKQSSKKLDADRPTVSSSEDAVEAPKVLETGKAEAPKGFFKANRLSGGWSQEARDIERDFNIQ